MSEWKCVWCVWSSVWSVVKSIMRNEGPQGFFQGLTTTIAREIPGYFCFFGAYELCRTGFADYMTCEKDDIGTGSGTITLFRSDSDAVTLYLLHVLKVWLRSYSAAASEACAFGWWSTPWTVSNLGFRSCPWRGSRRGFSKPSWPSLALKVGTGRKGRNYRHVAFCFLSRYQSCVVCLGVRALYSGLTPTVVRCFPANGALFLGYEVSRKLMMKQFDNWAAPSNCHTPSVALPINQWYSIYKHPYLDCQCFYIL